MLKKFTLVLMFGLLVAALGTALAQDDGLSGEINVYPQNYYNPEADPETAAIVEKVAQDYMDMHPGVTINLIPNLPTGTNYDTWLASRMTAGQAPDIAWDQYGNRNRVQGDWWVPMDEFLEMPNPYIAEGTPGHDRWMDSFPDYVMNQTRAPDGHWYQVSLDWVETALYYNADMFKEAGVEANWADWTDFVADMNKIRDTLGVDPVGLYQAGSGWSTWYWADDVFLSAVWHDLAPELMMEKYTEMQPGRDFRMLNTEEVAKAIHDGVLNATDPRMDTYLNISKEFTDLLPIDYIGITSLDDIQRLFLSHEVASFWGGTWQNKQIDESADFEWGVAYLPPFTEADFPGAPGVSYRVGGPSSAGQYGIPVSTSEAGNLQLAADFLMWMSAPQNFGPMASTYRAFIPMVAGTEGGDVVKNFGSVAALPERLFTDPSARLTLEAGDEWSAAMQAYFLGQTDLETTKQTLQDIWQRGVEAVCEQQSYDWCAS